MKDEVKSDRKSTEDACLTGQPEEEDEECGCGSEHGHEHGPEHHHEEDEECGCGSEHGLEHGFEHHHHHEEDEECGCGHEHGHEHGPEHHHHHEEDEKCGCGHEHGPEHHHHHEEGEECGCGHEHGHEHGPEHHHHHEHDDCGEEEHPGEHSSEINTDPDARVFLVENLDCAHCAAKMEERIAALPGVTAASLTYTTKKLRVSGRRDDQLLDEIREICTSIESEVKVVPLAQHAADSRRTAIYRIENLDCAHCAAKMEERISRLDGIEDAVLTFSTKQLRVTAAHPEQYLDDIIKICTSIESEVKISLKKKETRREEAQSAAEQKAEHEAAQKKELAIILVGACLFALGILFNHRPQLSGIPALVIFAAAYLLLGGKVLIRAAKNLSHGQVFDENFLMSIATIGALCIREFPEAVGVMLFYRIGDYFEDRAVEKSRSQIMEAADLRPEEVNLVFRDNDIRVIPAEEAAVGDLLLIRPGDRIPLDGVVTEGSSRIDTSPITGEPVPRAVHPGDELISGCVNTSGELVMRVEKVLSESMVTRILDSVENAAAGKPKLDRFITRFAKVYTPIVVMAAVAVAVFPSLFTGNWYYWIYTACTFLVISCPCAMVLSVPLAFFSGIGAGSRKGILFKGGRSMEALSKIGAVVVDKTGTITEGNFVLQKLIPADSFTEEELLSLCAGCEAASAHPIAASIVAAAGERGLEFQVPGTLQEIPGHGIAAETARGMLLCGNRKLLEKYQVALPEDSGEIAGAEVYVALGGVYAGRLVISDTIKADAKTSIAALKKLGLHTVMLTGDSENSAQAAAREAGIEEVHAKLLPQEKLSVLKKVRKEHGAVLFVGDGINDAPVLAGADVGAAMGSGADAAIEAADAVFMTSEVNAIPQAIRIARGTNRIAVQNVVFALAIKILVMILGLGGYANMWMAVFADTGVAMLCVLNSIRALYIK